MFLNRHTNTFSAVVALFNVTCCAIVIEWSALSGVSLDKRRNEGNVLFDDALHSTQRARCSFVVERSLVVRWVDGSILHGAPIELILISASVPDVKGRKCFIYRRTQHILFTVIWRQTCG